jgi:hypothetical protein
MKKRLRAVKGNKRVLIIIFSLVAIFLIYVFSGCKYSFSTRSWHCSSPRFTSAPRWKKSILEEVCIKGGGIPEYSVVDLGSRTTFSCIKPFPDYGDPCDGPNDCEGECEMVGTIPRFCYKVGDREYRCSQKIKGTCSYKSYNIFDGWKEVLENKIIVHEEAII